MDISLSRAAVMIMLEDGMLTEEYSPFFMYHTIGGDNGDILKNLKEHVTLFRKNVVTDEVYLESDTIGI